MAWPNLFILGPPRSGTTSLYEGLRQHPEIYMSQMKEPKFFIAKDPLKYRWPRAKPHGTWTAAEYQRLFRDGADAKVRGEATAVYTYSAESPDLISESVPDAKAIIILRNPADRAYSHYVYSRMRGIEDAPTFKEALDQEPRRLYENWTPYMLYKDMGYYHRQIKRWRDALGDRLLVLRLEDLHHDRQATFRRVFKFLEVDPDHPVVQPTKLNAGGQKQDNLAAKILGHDGPLKRAASRLVPERYRMAVWAWLNDRTLKKPTFPDKLRQGLLADYAEDIQATSELIGRDLTDWLDDVDPVVKSRPLKVDLHRARSA